MPFDAQRAQEIFVAASELIDVSERAAILDRECGGDAELRRRVEILLAAHDDSAGLPAADPHGTGAFVPGGNTIELTAGTALRRTLQDPREARRRRHGHGLRR